MRRTRRIPDGVHLRTSKSIFDLEVDSVKKRSRTKPSPEAFLARTFAKAPKSSGMPLEEHIAFLYRGAAGKRGRRRAAQNA